jgi:transposase
VGLPHSDGCFVKAYPAETAEAFCDGHVAAFDFFGGVPQSILYDNTGLAVAKIIKGGERLRSQMFAELQSHYLFEDRFGRPGNGNDKDKVGYVRRNFMTPLPVADARPVDDDRRAHAGGHLRVPAAAASAL